MACQGPAESVISEYWQLITTSQGEEACSSSSSHTLDDLPQLAVELLPIPLSSGPLSSRAPARAYITHRGSAPLQFARIHLSIYKADHTLCCVVDSAAAVPRLDLHEIDPGGGIEIVFEALQLTPGQYYLMVRMTDISDAAVIAYCQSPLFRVVADAMGDQSGVFVPRTSWRALTPSASTIPINLPASSGDQHG